MSQPYHFEISLFARPHEIEPTDAIVLRSVELLILDGTALLRGETFACSFEQAAHALAKLTRLDVEPDGYFVWTGDQGGDGWQVDGGLFDRAGRLWRVDLKGSCPRERFDALLACFGWPQTRLVFQLVREGVTIDETDFRRWAAAG